MPAKRLWFIDAKGRALPAPLIDSPAYVLNIILDHVEEAGRFDELIFGPSWEDANIHRALSLLDSPQRASVFLEMGMSGPAVLFIERTGHLPDIAVWFHWEKTGRWLVHPASSVEYREAVQRGLEAVIKAYPYLPEDADATRPCEFEEAVLVISKTYGPSELRPEAANFFPALPL